MSVRSIQGQGGYRALGGSNIGAKTLRAPVSTNTKWVRNPLWPEVAAPGENEILGLYACFGDSLAPDYFSCSMVMLNAGSYRIQLGDGTDTTVANNTQYNTIINYEALPDLGLPYRVCTVCITPASAQPFTQIRTSMRHPAYGTGSNAPKSPWLELKINAPSANYVYVATGDSVASSAMTTPLLENLEVTAAHNDSYGWSYVSRGADNLIRYVVKTTNSSDFNFSSLFSGKSNLIEADIQVLGTGKPANLSSLFYGCVSMSVFPKVEITSAATTNLSRMFYNCKALTSAPFLNTDNVTNMSNMFYGCASLTDVPVYNTSAITNMSNMFYGCTALVSVPLFNTVAVTNMSYMFSGCTALVSVPLFNTAAVTDMSYMFSGCASLASVPLFDTVAVTNMSYMFSTCTSLASVPLFDTASVTTMAAMFSGCTALASVPLFNTVAVTNMSSMFNACTSLVSVPLFNTPSVTSVATMFNGCASLLAVPALDLADVSSATNISNMVINARVCRIQAFGARFTHTIANNTLSGAALDEYYTGLGTVTGQTITVTGNYGTTSDTPSIATAKGWTVTGT